MAKKKTKIELFEELAGIDEKGTDAGIFWVKGWATNNFSSIIGLRHRKWWLK